MDEARIKKLKGVVICYFIFSVVFAILTVFYPCIVFAIYSIGLLLLATLGAFRIYYYHATKTGKKERGTE